MYERILEYEEPPKPEIKIDDFEGGITTRLMAKRLSGSSDEARRNSLNFPPGSFVPNSNILLNRRKSQIEEEDTKSASGSGITVSNLVAYREEHPEKSTMSESPTTSDSPLQKLRESVRRRSRSGSRNSMSTHRTSQNDQERSIRRVSRRTSVLEVEEVRKTSPQSLKRSIDNSDQEVEILNVDELVDAERRGSKGRNSYPRVSFQKEQERDALPLVGHKPNT